MKLVVSIVGVLMVGVFELPAIGIFLIPGRTGEPLIGVSYLKYYLFGLSISSAVLFFGLYRYVLNFLKLQEHERKTVEKRLVVYSARLNSVTEFPENVSTYTLTTDFRYVSFNALHCKEMKKLWNAEVVEGKSILDLLPKKYCDAALKNYQRAISGEHFKITTLYEGKYFTHVFSPVLNKHEEITGLTSSIFEVTDRIKAEQELESYKDQLEDLVQERTEQLQKQAAFFQKVLDGLPNLIFVRSSDLRYVLANKAMIKSFNLSEKDVIGKTIRETHHDPDDAKKYEKEDRSILRKDKIIEEETLSLFGPEDKRWMFRSKRRLVINNEEYVLGVHFDITNLKETELKLIKANRELKDTLTRLQSAQMRLIESEKMASLGQLTAGLAHEINNPINYVSGNVRPIRRDLAELRDYLLAKEKGESNQYANFDFRIIFDELESLLDGVDEGTVRVKNLMNDLNTFSLPDTSRKHLHDINESIKTTLNLVKHNVKDRIQMDIKLNNLSETWCNPQQLSQVFLNILNNAIQSIVGDGKISVTTRQESDVIIVKIKDTGDGIPEENLKRIFDPFFTTKDVGQGTGLGLAISYRIVEEHGGKIDVTSKSGKGTCFKIILPVRQSVS